MKVFHRPEQAATNPDSFSPSARKPTLVVEDWLRRGIVTPEDVKSFPPATMVDFERAHDRDFVRGVFDLEIENGFDNFDVEVAESLRYTSGSMIAAAQHALLHKESAASPTSGFHHAGYARARGFCTFNGLMVTALKLAAEGSASRIAILDCDVHYGDGTAEIIRRLKVASVVHCTMGQHFHERADVGRDGSDFFKWLRQSLEACEDADILLYQAGADPHLDDPLGGLLSEEAMMRRDELVFQAWKGRALAWNLAGGYQREADGGIEPVLRLHRNTMLAALAVERQSQ